MFHKRPCQPQPLFLASGTTTPVFRRPFATRLEASVATESRPSRTTADVIDLITPPKSSAMTTPGEDFSKDPETPCQGSSGLRKSARLLEKTKLGRDSSRVKISERISSVGKPQAKVLSTKVDNQQSKLSILDDASAPPKELSVTHCSRDDTDYRAMHLSRANDSANPPTSHMHRASDTYYQTMIPQPYLHHAPITTYYGTENVNGLDSRPQPHGFYMYPYSHPSHARPDSHYAMRPPQNGYQPSTQ